MLAAVTQAAEAEAEKVVPQPTKKARKADTAPVEAKAKKAAPEPPAPGSAAHLKVLIRQAGIPIPPNVYVRAKAEGEGEEKALHSALLALLRSEGLDSSSKPAECKKVKERRDLARDLEGIDASNVVEGRRRGGMAAAPVVVRPPAVTGDSEDSDEA